MIFSGGDSLPTDIVDVDETEDAEGDVWGCPLCPLSTMLAARDRTSNGDSGRWRKKHYCRQISKILLRNAGAVKFI